MKTAVWFSSTAHGSEMMELTLLIPLQLPGFRVHLWCCGEALPPSEQKGLENGISSTYNPKAPYDVTLKIELSKKTTLNKINLIVDREAVTSDSFLVCLFRPHDIYDDNSTSLDHICVVLTPVRNSF